MMQGLKMGKVKDITADTTTQKTKASIKTNGEEKIIYHP